MRLESFNLKLKNSSVSSADTSSINRGGAGILIRTYNPFRFKYISFLVKMKVQWVALERIGFNERIFCLKNIIFLKNFVTRFFKSCVL